MSAAIRMQGVTKRFGSIKALDGLDLEIPKGTICGLVGPNGAGKTTTFSILGGFLKPDQGQVDILGTGPFSIAKHRGRLTMLPQDAQPSPHMRTRSLLVHFGRLQGLSGAEASKEADRVLEAVGLKDRAKSKTRQLSHGMKRRVTIAQALMGTPELILLDEPTSGLDPELVVQMRQLFQSYKGKSTMVISSHQLAELEATCDYVVFMDKGTCPRHGTMNEVTGGGGAAGVTLSYRLNRSPADQPIRAAIPGAHWEWNPETNTLTCQSPPNWEFERVNAEILRLLLDQGVGIIEVRAGKSLEDAYMSGRQ